MAYSKKDWNNDETITEEALDNIETGIDTNDKSITALQEKVTTLESKVVDATTAKQGLVKQCTLVAEASGENVTKAEFKALLDSLKTAGIMSST